MFNDGNILRSAVTKEVKSNPKQPSCKKGCSLKKTIVKKELKSKVAAKKWL